MDQKEFNGNLEDISPHLLINKYKSDKFQNFFLILGMIFNDLKGFIFFQRIIEDVYRKPVDDEVSLHMGEYSGLMSQANKFLIAIISEFLIFLEKNRNVWSSVPFLLLLKKLDPNIQRSWYELTHPEENTRSITSKIARVRSNVAFHYDHSTEQLRSGFVRSFFSESKDLVQHKRAYFSFGETMEQTRFFYSDAAAEEYVKSIVSGVDMVSVRKTIDDMNFTIRSLLLEYIQSIKLKARQKHKNHH